jgi:hypothetical protein
MNLSFVRVVLPPAHSVTIMVKYYQQLWDRTDTSDEPGATQNLTESLADSSELDEAGRISSQVLISETPNCALESRIVYVIILVFFAFLRSKMNFRE